MVKAVAGTGNGIEIFEYPASPGTPAPLGWEGFAEEGTPVSSAEEPAQNPAAESCAAVSTADLNQRVAEETRRSFEAGREQGLREGRQAEREAQAVALRAEEERRAQQSAAFVESFTAERDRYFSAVEHEVVELALAVAARILRREAQMDPLLLTGAVRVALGQLSASTEVRLRVPSEEHDLWKEAVAALPNLNVKPVVEAGEGMRLGDCVMETALGSVDLGIRSQLGEIERGFFDRFGMRKQERAEPVESVAMAEEMR